MIRRLFRDSARNLHDREGDPGRPQYRRSISTRLRWSYLISSTLPLLLVGTLLIFLNFRTQEKSVYNEQVMLALQGVREISNFLSSIELQLLSTGQNMQPGVSAKEWELAARELINMNFPDLHEVSVYNLDGIRIAHFSLKRDSASTASISPTTTSDPLISSALNGIGYRSDITLDSEGERTFTIALPLRNKIRKPVGAIKAKVSAIQIEQSLRRLERGSDSIAYLVNDNNDVMIGTSNSSWKPPPSLDTFLNPSLEEYEEHLVYERDNNRVVVYKNGNGDSALGVISPIFPSKWTVIIEQPLRIAFSNVWNNVIILGVLVVVVGLIGLGWGLTLSQNFVDTLKALRRGALMLGSGHLDHRIDIKSTDEMGQLAWSFNQMASRLQQSLTEIEEQNNRLLEDLQLARDIQMGLLPDHPPWDNEILMVHARSIPASEVGGDFYSYMALPDDRAAISVGDISGKGVGAALMMALTSSMLESQARQTAQPAEVLNALNRILFPRMKTNHMNAAILYAVFDIEKHVMVTANAGMISPLLIRWQAQEVHAADGGDPGVTCRFLDVGGLPVGSINMVLYHDITEPLQEDDILLFLSDGVIEAHNEAGEMFGFERFEEFVSTLHNYPEVLNNMHLLVDLIIKQVQTFVGEASQHDDITVMAVRPTLSVYCDTWGIQQTTLPSSQPVLDSE